MNPFEPGTPEYQEWSRQVAGEGAALLDELLDALTRYVVFPSSEAAHAVVAWIAATHAQPAWEHAPRLVAKSPIRQCGKTRLQEIARELAHRPLCTTNISVAALVRSLGEEDPPTIMLDEADAIFATRRGERSEGAEDIRGILNSGHARGWPYIRWDATARRLDECPTFAMAMLGGIGDLPDTIEDRAVIVPMRRRAADERVQPFRARRDRPALLALRDRLHGWVRDRVDELAKAEPAMPVEDRPADVWEPLVAIADAAGGPWPARIRAACMAMTGAGQPDDATAGERLLADLHAVFGEAQNLYTATILGKLHAVDEAPWADWYGKPLDSRGLAKLLKPYGIRSRNVREGGTGDVGKGYARADLADAWRRYIRYSATGSPSSEVSAVADRVADDATGTATGLYQPELTDVADVARVAHERQDTGSNWADDLFEREH